MGLETWRMAFLTFSREPGTTVGGFLSRCNPPKDNFHNFTLLIDIPSASDILVSKGIGRSSK